MVNDDMEMRSTKGSLLVAVPLLADPNFHRSVIYVLQHTEDGALGLILNRPTDQDRIAGLDPWIDELSPPQVVFGGGPVQADTLIAVASLAHPLGEDDTDGFAPIDDRLGTVDLSQLPTGIAEGLQHLRVFRGYSGWGPGQLEEEIDEGSWISLRCDVADLFTPNPLGLWRNVLRRAGGRPAILADAPENLSLN